jgi:alkaline phosphatase
MRASFRFKAGMVLAACALAFNLGQAEGRAPARSAILFIGDGMGPGIVSIVKLYAERSLGRELNMVRLANSGTTGYMTTHAEDRMVTDSAAAGTALATGCKTDNGMVGVTPEGEVVASLFELAVKAGKSVGVVTTTSVTDATPAAFLAHAHSRQMHFEIAEQIAEGDASVVLGGGYWYFLPPGKGKRPDNVDLTQVARERGFDVAFDRAAMNGSTGERILGLFADELLPFERDRDRETVPSIGEMTMKALDVLGKDPDGFFLMVEGGRIDHAEHANSISDAVADLLAFDEAIGWAMSYQEGDSTLTIVVSADHDCGGPAITASGYGYPSYEELDKVADGNCRFIRWVSGQHTGTMVPVFAGGPGSERFSGIQSNAGISRNLAGLLGL